MPMTGIGFCVSSQNLPGGVTGRFLTMMTRRFKVVWRHCCIINRNWLIALDIETGQGLREVRPIRRSRVLMRRCFGAFPAFDGSGAVAGAENRRKG